MGISSKSRETEVHSSSRGNVQREQNDIELSFYNLVTVLGENLHMTLCKDADFINMPAIWPSKRT